MVELAGRLIVPPRIRIVPGFLDPQIRLFCPRGGAPDYQRRGRATGRFLRQPLSQTSGVLNRESVLCQIENDEKQCNVEGRLEKGGNLSANFCRRLEVGRGQLSLEEYQ